MATRMGLDRAAVIAAAVRIVDREGLGALSMTRLAAELGIRGPSLYAHVQGQAGLRRELWLWVVADLGDRLRDSVMGRSGEAALSSFAEAMRDYARRYQGRYQLTLDPPVPLDDEAKAVRRRANAAFEAMIASFGVHGEQARHAGRALRAAIHGFVALEATDAIGDHDVDASFDTMLMLLARGLAPQHQQAEPAAASA